MNKLEKKIIKQIKSQKLKPKSKFYFMAIRWFAILILGASVVFGSMSFAVLFLMYVNLDFGLTDILFGAHALAYFVQIGFLYYLGALFASFVGVYIYQIFSKYGYRYTSLQVGLAFVSITALAGYLIFAFGYAGQAYRTLSSLLPFAAQENIYQLRKQIWHQPQKGLYSGVLINATDGQKILLAPDKKQYHLDEANLSGQDRIILELSPAVVVFANPDKDNPQILQVCAAKPLPPHELRNEFRKMLQETLKQSGYSYGNKNKLFSQILLADETKLQNLRTNWCKERDSLQTN